MPQNQSGYMRRLKVYPTRDQGYASVGDGRLKGIKLVRPQTKSTAKQILGESFSTQEERNPSTGTESNRQRVAHEDHNDLFSSTSGAGLTETTVEEGKPKT